MQGGRVLFRGIDVMVYRSVPVPTRSADPSVRLHLDPTARETWPSSGPAKARPPIPPKRVWWYGFCLGLAGWGTTTRESKRRKGVEIPALLPCPTCIFFSSLRLPRAGVFHLSVVLYNYKQLHESQSNQLPDTSLPIMAAVTSGFCALCCPDVCC
jgi:hypothetical protein